MVQAGFIVGFVYFCSGSNLVASSSHPATTDHQLVYHGHDAYAFQYDERTAAGRTTAGSTHAAAADTLSIGSLPASGFIYGDMWHECGIGLLSCIVTEIVPIL